MPQNKKNQFAIISVPLNEEEVSELAALETRLSMKRAEVLRAALKIIHNMDGDDVIESAKALRARVWNIK